MTDDRPQTDLSRHDASLLLDAHSDVLELAATGAALPALLDEITTTLERLLPDSQCSVLLLDPAAYVLRHGSAPSLPRAYLEAIDGLAPGPAQGSCGTAAHFLESVVTEDIDTDPRWEGFRSIANDAGLRACWSVPLLGHGRRVLGTFAVYHASPHRPQPRERLVIERLTYLTSVTIEHAAMLGALAESEERFRRAFEDNAVGMALIDTDGAVHRTNQAMLDLVGLPRTEVISSRLVDFVAGTDRSDLAAGLQVVWSGRQREWQAETTVTRPDGDVRSVSMTLSLVRGARGDPLQVSVNLLDITERLLVLAERRARREAELARRHAEAASRAKSDLLSMVSHDMRTPLQAITGFAEVLATLDLDGERRREALGHITSGAQHLLDLVDDTLDLARAEGGALPLNPDGICVSSALAEVVEFLQPLAGEHGVVLVIDEAPGTAWADPRRVRQVLINLLSNAIRYSGPHGIVHVGSAVDGDTLQILVADDGPGIAPELHERLFQPFSSFDVQVSDRPEGVGLGLVVARALAEAMGGTVTVTSDPGCGTVAALRLPTPSDPPFGLPATPRSAEVSR